mmetsp:Transcript_127284/g.283823  ORF Transcript_127284/g.283823 Transcript_127284/m.283823 type:complete len:275 (+) Transcript_127284:53-877(+)
MTSRSEAEAELQEPLLGAEDEDEVEVAGYAAATCFLAYAVCHACIADCQILLAIQAENVSPGTVFVVLIALALVWDNGLLVLGRRIYSKPYRAEDYRMLAFLSQPRFICHALLTPFLAVQAAYLGSRGGVTWLTPAAIWAVWIVCSLFSLAGTAHHYFDPHLTLRRPHPKEPKGSWMRSITSMTLASLSDESASKGMTMALLIGPAVLVCIFTIVVGASMGGTAVSLRAGRWLWVTSVIELLSNAGPPWTMQITGNAGEVILLLGYLMAFWVMA